ncbi:hypothetical protein MO973_36690 [Paenibacillus sp. TRM 82003]|uniref:hypothetical protein n=1 Tax=Kineococcus sp. TRM81007 TaxID=2925831 RepID=UPI001F5A936E|nr:hypothetical protein [Kineococcus sp. TRM81007]MCI2239945.1 hypothetical protein [Kineococcus sp. TRM81007]MCI3925750.1 hypothetical protein [Paenibacillus sp. TRM 82003]
MRGLRAVLVAGAAALLVAGGAVAWAPDSGVREIHPTRPGGMHWESAWDEPRSFGSEDPQDPWFATDGSGSYAASGGELAVSGRAPRMYVRDPSLQEQWRDVEITTYFMRRSDEGVPYAGMTAVARSNHGVTGPVEEDLCDSRGYGARMRYDGLVDFEKETAHPANEAAASEVLWPDGMPTDVWFGYKFVVHDLPDGNVKLELWLDTSGGEDGGDWRLVNELVDDGEVFGDEACAEGIDPAMPLTASPDRPGSESGKPNLSVYFRSDGVHEGGLVYRDASVREIVAPTGG